MLKKPMEIEKVIAEALSGLEPRQRNVLEKRFGLKNGKETTLAELGEAHEVTRERIRQIETGAIKEIREKIGGGRGIFDAVRDYLKNYGGARREDLLLGDLRSLFASASPFGVFSAQMKFLREVFGDVRLFPENEGLRSFWYLNEENKKTAIKLIGDLARILASKKEEVITHKKFDSLFGKALAPHALKDFIGLNFLSISKKFNSNPFGDFGLSEWPEITPKRIGDKAYLVLKKTAQPMHFRELTKAINLAKFDRRTAYPQTVHNELIKDSRFVLVGRGSYSLREFGLLPGTVKEIIARFIKKRGPMNSEDVAAVVCSERLFKKNTVLLNLQNKKLFKRLDDGRYSLIRDA
ncbi:MAG: hypothetical protein HZA37_02450 [Parcubacteria group bacterium]|nr:hypothetical protein [Parcubacteria group bacterium]